MSNTRERTITIDAEMEDYHYSKDERRLDTVNRQGLKNKRHRKKAK